MELAGDTFLRNRQHTDFRLVQSHILGQLKLQVKS